MALNNEQDKALNDYINKQLADITERNTMKVLQRN